MISHRFQLKGILKIFSSFRKKKNIKLYFPKYMIFVITAITGSKVPYTLGDIVIAYLMLLEKGVSCIS